jgi:hypothetical protein
MANSGSTGILKTIISRDKVTIGDMLLAVSGETRFLSHLTSNKNEQASSLVTLCIENGYLTESLSGPDSTLARKDAAYFFLSVAKSEERSRSLGSKYSAEYSRSNHPSPVPDVKVSDYFFDAVLVLVEREIIDLPDGIDFFPDKPLSGTELAEIIYKLKKLYK